MYAQLRRTDAVIFLATKAAVTSQWCFSEVSLARALGRPVIPLRLEREVRLPLLGNTQWVDFSDTEAGFDRLLAGLRAAGLDPTRAYPWDPRRSPYPGLIPFATEDAAVFFGRERETARLVELLQPTLQHGPGRFVAVVGPSGSGKSSLVCGGLLPRLSRSTTQWVPLPPLLPGPTPTRNLAAGLARAFAERSHPRSVEELAAALEEGPAGLRQLAGELAELEQNGAGRVNVLVVIDQAEELLTRAGPVEQQAFLRLLTGALGEDSPLWVVASVRSEFLSMAPDRAGLAEAVDDSLMIEPLSRARLAEVIARPAQRAGLELDPAWWSGWWRTPRAGTRCRCWPTPCGNCASEPDPTARSAWLTEDIGGVVGALQHRADQLTEELRRRGHGELVVPTLLRLAAVTGYDDPIRRRVRRESLTPEEQAVVDRFVDARLLTSNQVAPAHHSGELAAGRQAGTQHVAGTAPTATVEVAHEALLRQWPPLREAIEADRAALRRLSDLERLAADWHQGHRDELTCCAGVGWPPSTTGPTAATSSSARPSASISRPAGRSRPGSLKWHFKRRDAAHSKHCCWSSSWARCWRSADRHSVLAIRTWTSTWHCRFSAQPSPPAIPSCTGLLGPAAGPKVALEVSCRGQRGLSEVDKGCSTLQRVGGDHSCG